MNPFEWLTNPEGALKVIWDITRDVMEWTQDWGSVAPGTAGWAASIELAGFWIGLTAFVVTVATGAVAIVRGLLTNRREDVIRAALGVAFSVPATLATIWLIAELLKLLDYIPDMLTTLNEGETAVEAITAALGLNESSDLLMETVKGNFAAAYMNAILIFFGFICIGAVRIVRGIGIMSMVAFAPFVFTMLPLREGSDVGRNYSMVLAGLLLTDPILLGMLWMLTRMTALVEDPWSTQGLTASVGLALLGITPMAVLGIFTWAGADRDAGGHATMRGVGQAGRTAGRIGGRGAAAVGRAAPAAGRGALKAGKAAGRGMQTAAQKTRSGIGRITGSGSSGGRGKSGSPGTPGSTGPSGSPKGTSRPSNPGGRRPSTPPPSAPPAPGKP